jgi:hypothetical protein
VRSYLLEFGLSLRHVCEVVRWEVLCSRRTVERADCGFGVAGYTAGVVAVCLTVKLVGQLLIVAMRCAVKSKSGAAGLPRSHDSPRFLTQWRMRLRHACEYSVYLVEEMTHEKAPDTHRVNHDSDQPTER